MRFSNTYFCRRWLCLLFKFVPAFQTINAFTSKQFFFSLPDIKSESLKILFAQIVFFTFECSRNVARPIRGLRLTDVLVDLQVRCDSGDSNVDL